MNVSVKLDSTECCVCGVAFAIPAQLMKKRQEDGEIFYCPNGHSQVFCETVRSELKREQENFAIAKRRIEYLEQRKDHLERSRNGVRGKLTQVTRELDRLRDLNGEDD